MRTDLLIALRDKLRSLPPELFDINQWRSDCGTVACAAGWACTMPEFNRAGLHMTGDPGAPAWYKDNPEYCGRPVLYNYTALQKVLECRFHVTNGLFNPEYYSNESPVTPSQVANRIQFLITYGEYEFLRLFNEEYHDD